MRHNYAEKNRIKLNLIPGEQTSNKNVSERDNWRNREEKIHQRNNKRFLSFGGWDF